MVRESLRIRSYARMLKLSASIVWSSNSAAFFLIRHIYEASDQTAHYSMKREACCICGFVSLEQPAPAFAFQRTTMILFPPANPSVAILQAEDRSDPAVDQKYVNGSGLLLQVNRYSADVPCHFRKSHSDTDLKRQQVRNAPDT